MGDRNHPIKFGPEWLRNLARERNAGAGGTSNSPNAVILSGATSPGATGPLGSAMANSSAANIANTANTPPKVQLAKLRYGREEMLALYDRTSEAPPELKYIDILYQARGKPPVALNNIFEDEMRETMRTGPPIGGISPGERFGIGRGMGRGLNLTDGRGRPRVPFVRQAATGRGASWHLGSPRMPGYSSGADEDTSQSIRSWSSSNGSNTAVRNSGDLSEWTPNKMFRNKRPGSNTNWRQPTRDDGEEWRSPDMNRTRSQQDKWERDWGDRPNQEKPQSWNTNRRTWVGGDSQNNEDNLPEWAMDGTEAGAGTFDSSGAFHGYSNDDTNLPKSQESAYPLTRSHTHSSFVRSKTMEEGSDEWWASEKAKKLSPKRFDASDIKFKKKPTEVHLTEKYFYDDMLFAYEGIYGPYPSTNTPDKNVPGISNTKYNVNKEETPLNKPLEKSDTPAAAPDPPETNANLEESYKKVRFAESKTFDALMRSDINLEEANDERGNFQSVMITPNNSLRQKHQNMVPASGTTSARLLKLLQNAATSQATDSELSKQHQTHMTPEDKLVDDILDLALEEKEILSNLATPSESPLMNTITSSIAMSPGMSTIVNSMSQISTSAMPVRMPSPVLSNQPLGLSSKPNITAPVMQGTVIQSVGITNSALNASLGLPHRPSSREMGSAMNQTMAQTMGMPIQGVPPPVIPNQGIGSPGMGPTALQNAGPGLPGFPSSGGIPGMSSAVANTSRFLGQNTNNAPLQPPNEIQMPNHVNQSDMFPLHGVPHSGAAGAYSSSIYSNIIPQSPAPPSNNQSLAEQWFYEDPKKNIQGPFTSKDMDNWFRAGFFSPSLMVRRACDPVMRPLGSYGPVVPFAQMDMMYPLSGYDRNPAQHESMLNTQQGLGLDMMNMSNLTEVSNSMESMQFGTVGLVRNPPYNQQQMDSLWSQPSPPDLMWMQQAMNTRNETRVNNLPMFFWDQQPSAISSNALLPEEIAKEMKTEDQILAQLRASQNISTPQNIHYMNEPPSSNAVSNNKPEDTYQNDIKTNPNLEDLQKFMQDNKLKAISSATDMSQGTRDLPERMEDQEQIAAKVSNTKSQQSIPVKISSDSKALVQTKAEIDKNVKNGNNKTKSKKLKEDKKEENVEQVKLKDEEIFKSEKKSEDSLLAKKKDEKSSKKELEKEKKEWIKEGFTIVKGVEKTVSKENKKKVEEVKVTEEAERTRKEEERLVAEEDKKRKQMEAQRKQQEMQQLRQAAESVSKKAPWSAVTNQAMQTTNKDGLTLAEIQRLEREKKLEQMKEQQQMMQIIAQQQAAALAREQEMQAGLGWKKKGTDLPGQSLAEIQAETRKQAVVAAASAAAAATAQALEETQISSLPQMNHLPWGNTHTSGGFWDTQPNQNQKAQTSPKNVEQSKNKKKIGVNLATKKEVTPAAEFEAWCTTALTSWTAKIDVPTFVGFLKDIESPYEVKDYVKCYLGETKESSDFARQFLERRSKLLRVGMVTPSDDLCSPAMAVNPRALSNSDYQEVKTKKTKKNKMLKVDARILGFSVTAAEDRINVGDIDTV